MTEMTRGRVFIIESPNPLDLLENRGERIALEQVCKLVGHDAVTFLVRDKNEFCQTCSYISSINWRKDDKTPLFIHISSHGNQDGIAIGPDLLDWEFLSETLQKMYERLKHYPGPVLLIISACGANEQKLTRKLAAIIRRDGYIFPPPKYIFVFADDEVAWIDTVVTWTIFYRKALELDFSDSSFPKVKKFLNILYTADYGKLMYFRWNEITREYRWFQPEIINDLSSYDSTIH